MGAPNGSDIARVARGCEPVVNGSPDPAALDWWLTATVMSRDQQHDAIAARNRLGEPAVDRGPGSVEIHPVKIEHAVRLDRAAAQLSVPAAVERLLANRHGPDWARRSRLRDGVNRSKARPDLMVSSWNMRELPARQRPNGGGDTSPQLCFLRAEGAHLPPRSWGPGSMPRPMPTCRRRSRPPLRQRPRRYRIYSGP